MQKSKSASGPRRLGKYILYERLGEGSMGRVHRARVLGIGGAVKDLCIKRIHAKRLERPGALTAFVAEARTWMRLAHALIVPVFDFGRAGDEYYLAMEWVSGVDLRVLLDRAKESSDPMPPELCAHVTAEIARALDYAHGLEPAIVHRDVKPENVLVSSAGDVRLTDFGVATVAGEQRGAGGTPGYMAPEQKQRGSVDGRCDVYALGILLREMITSRSPGSRRPPTQPIPGELEIIVARMCSADPADRPLARDVADTLEGYVARYRAGGSAAPRDLLTARVAACQPPRRAEVPPSAEIEPELSFVQDGEDPAFVTQMTTLVGRLDAPAHAAPRVEPTSPTIDAPASESDDDGAAPPNESRLGRYQLCFELASGGMASVFLARVSGAAGFEKLVALKRIHPHLANDPEFVEMFLDEARIASRINHPNVCSVFDFGRAGGTYYIAMEYVFGETLSTLLARLYQRPEVLADPRWPCFAARIVADVCEGLHAAHELRGDKGELLHLIHRDVTPQNLFVGYDGSISIVDFGIARAAGRLHHTRVGQLKGKLAYVAPEQGKRAIELDRRADIWSLGVVLWELLCARSLFRGETKADTITAVLARPVPPPSHIRPDVGEELDRIVVRALSRDRDERYPTAREMGRALNRYIAHTGEPVTPADVADWMDEHFAEEKSRREELVEQSRHTPAGAVPRVSARLGGELASDPLEQVPTVRGSDLLGPERSRAARRRISRLSIALAAGAIVGVVAAIVTGEREPPRDESPRAIAASRDLPDLVRTVAAPPDRPAAEEIPPPIEIDEPIVAPAAADVGLPAEVAEEPVEREESGSADPRRARAPRRTRLRPGTLSIATPGGWAEVFVGARRVGRAPGEVHLPAGAHLVRLKPCGRGAERRRRVHVPPGGQARLVVQIDPEDCRP